MNCKYRTICEVVASLALISTAWSYAQSAETKNCFKLEEATIADVQAAMKSGKLTAHRLVEIYLAQIDAYDQKGPALNAVIVLNPHALADADALDAEFKRSGPIGPLHGIPVLVKDIVATQGIPTTAGSKSSKAMSRPRTPRSFGGLRRPEPSSSQNPTPMNSRSGARRSARLGGRPVILTT